MPPTQRERREARADGVNERLHPAAAPAPDHSSLEKAVEELAKRLYDEAPQASVAWDDLAPRFREAWKREASDHLAAIQPFLAQPDGFGKPGRGLTLLGLFRSSLGWAIDRIDVCNVAPAEDGGDIDWCEYAGAKDLLKDDPRLFDRSVDATSPQPENSGGAEEERQRIEKRLLSDEDEDRERLERAEKWLDRVTTPRGRRHNSADFPNDPILGPAGDRPSTEEYAAEALKELRKPASQRPVEGKIAAIRGEVELAEVAHSHTSCCARGLLTELRRILDSSRPQRQRCGGGRTQPDKRGATSAAGCSGCPDCLGEDGR